MPRDAQNIVEIDYFLSPDNSNMLHYAVGLLCPFGWTAFFVSLFGPGLPNLFLGWRLFLNITLRLLQGAVKREFLAREDRSTFL